MMSGRVLETYVGNGDHYQVSNKEAHIFWSCLDEKSWFGNDMLVGSLFGKRYT